MMTAQTTKLEEVVLGELIADKKPGFAIGQRSPDGVQQVRMNNVDTDGALDVSNAIRVPATEKQIRDCSLQEGDVLFNNTNSTELVGKSAIFLGHDETLTFSNHFTRLRTDTNRLSPRYLARWLTLMQRTRVFEGLCTRWVGQSAVKADKLLKLKIPLPPLPEQRRIADILDKADAVRRKRREAIGLTDKLPLSSFRQTFEKYLNPGEYTAVLSDAADVASGVAKGRRLNSDGIREVPYLRVANVQAGFLDISEMKKIPATPSEIETLSLQLGDVVMTEGGDYDKLGRGALWDKSVSDCIHQNHVFRVRTARSRLLPEFFVYFLQTQAAKSYFLRSAKKTTNLASINMTQLRALPVPLPPIALQQKYASELRFGSVLRERQRQSLSDVENVFCALVQRAFRGEL